MAIGPAWPVPRGPVYPARRMPPNLSVSFASEQESLSIRQFHVVERMSAPFEISIVALSPLDDIDAETLLGLPMSFRLAHRGDGDSEARAWTGVCSHFEQLQAEETGLSTYSIRLAQNLWMLEQRRNHRIFQHLTTPEIVGRILAEWGIAHGFEIDAGLHPKHEYRVQYGETDLAFLSRLLEDAGISYRSSFDPEKGSIVIFSDEPHRREPRAGGPIPYVDHPNVEARRDFVTRLRVARRIRPGAVALRDFDFRGRLDYELFGRAGPARGLEGGLEQYRYAPNEFVTEGRPGAEHAAHADEREGTARAERSLDAIRGPRLAVSFETNALDLAPGEVLTVSGHPKAEVSPESRLLVLELQIHGAANGAWTASARAARADTPHRPLRVTPRPRVSGVQSAIVTGPAGEEIYVDEYGRVKVQFHWDREGRRDEHSSCWIRVSQAWAGAGFGAVALPRVGQEVLVGFFEGDPDQPIVVGRVHNAVNQVPYKLPEHKTRSGLRTSSSPGAPDVLAYNELMFDDRKGAELVSLRAERDLQKTVRANEIERTGVDRTISVGQRRTTTIGAVDSTLVGVRHAVEVSSPAGNGTRLEMTDRRIVCTTGEATVTFDGPDLSLEAEGNITIAARTGDVVIRGGPNVKINCD
jgi:type VI secretion system secreted protein VgrG